MFVLNADSNGLGQIVERLQGQSGIDTLYVISHGSEGTLYLDSTVLNCTNFWAAAGFKDTFIRCQMKWDVTNCEFLRRPVGLSQTDMTA